MLKVVFGTLSLLFGRRPLLLTCQNGNITGLVRAWDYWKIVAIREATGGWFDGPIRVVNTFRFTDDPYKTTGDMVDYRIIMYRCKIISARFYVGPKWSPVVDSTLPEAYEVIFGKRLGRKLYAIEGTHMAH